MELDLLVTVFSSLPRQPLKDTATPSNQETHYPLKILGCALRSLAREPKVGSEKHTEQQNPTTDYTLGWECAILEDYWK